jgi:hypothetical protein
MRRTDAYRIYPEFKELLKKMRIAKGFNAGGEANRAEHALANAIDTIGKENRRILDRIRELQEIWDSTHNDYERHLRRMPKTNRKEAILKWKRLADELETKMNDTMQTIEDLFIQSNIRDRTSALLEITHYYRILVHGKLEREKLL